MIELSVRRPVGVAVGVILVVLFGGLSLFRIPIQLTPDIVTPQITVETTWFGATPHEIEREIIDEQEEQLRGVEGLDRITSESFDHMGRIILEFPPGTDLDTALILVSNRLEQVPEYPPDAEKPVILTTNKADNAMAWFTLMRLEGNDEPMGSFFRVADDIVKPRLERVRGVGSANVFGGQEEELHVFVRPEELAARGITIGAVIRALQRENVDISGGDFAEGKRKYKVRTVGEFERPAEVENTVLETRDGRRVYLRDVGEVRVGLKKRDSFVRQGGEPTIAINSVRRTGANVIETMRSLRQAVDELNEGALARHALRLVQVYDETDYIDGSIRNVVRNLLLGSLLAVVVLFFFLGSVASTMIVALAIPISVIGSFIFLDLFGRSLNVISLAGMSFAAGMVVDNAIVSLENIFRLNQEGRSAREAALDGARQIWGAILASTLTTIAVFVPILFVEEKAAQLFRDIAIAISCSVALSLLVSISVIPAMAARLLRAHARTTPQRSGRGMFDRFRNGLTSLVAFVIGGGVRRLVLIAFLTVGSLVTAWLFLPKAEYLPQGNRNLAIGILLPPPGYSIDELARVGEGIERYLRPYFRLGGGEAQESREMTEEEAPGVPQARAEQLARAAPDNGADDRPRIRHFFFVAGENNLFMGAVAEDSRGAARLIPILHESVSDVPGLITIIQQVSLFDRGVSTGRSIDVEITGPRLEDLIAAGGMIFGAIMQRFPFTEGHQARPIPSLDLQNPEIHVVPDRERARDLGLDAREIGVTVDAMIDGAKASEYMLEGREVDVIVMGSERRGDWRTQEIGDIPIATEAGRLVSLASVSDVEIRRGPQQINHIERDRAITIQLVPRQDVALEEAVGIVRDEIVAPLEQSGALPPDCRVRLAGTVDDLARAFDAFRWNFLLAIVITYLLLAALFESFTYPFVILFSLPLAAVGGVLCLDLVHAFTTDVRLDVLTMLGFVILVGVVVNNAILIVYQALHSRQAGAPSQQAVVEAVRSRIRPILMTTLTSGFGMLPLVLFPGEGSELYRGLGSVVVGGLAVSTIFTLFLVPSVLAVVFDLADRFGGGGRTLASEREA